MRIGIATGGKGIGVDLFALALVFCLIGRYIYKIGQNNYLGE